MGGLYRSVCGYRLPTSCLLPACVMRAATAQTQSHQETTVFHSHNKRDRFLLTNTILNHLTSNLGKQVSIQVPSARILPLIIIQPNERLYFFHSWVLKIKTPEKQNCWYYITVSPPCVQRQQPWSLPRLPRTHLRHRTFLALAWVAWFRSRTPCRSTWTWICRESLCLL